MIAKSLHIGINHVSPAHYGSDQPLKNAIADAQAMQSLARNTGFETDILLDNAATVVAVAQKVAEAANELAAGDFFFISYAGHGSQLFDRNGDEPSSLDSTWCLYDRMAIDDELHGLYVRFRPGVRLLIVSDSCHSGSVDRRLTMTARAVEDQNISAADGQIAANPVNIILEPGDLTRSLNAEVSRSVYLENQTKYEEAKALAGVARSLDVSCQKILLAACEDNQLAGDGDTNGYFTSWLLHIWNGGAFAGSYTQLHERLSGSMRQQQRPVLSAGGSDADAFKNQRPFII